MPDIAELPETTHTCTQALRDVRYGQQLIARKQAPEELLLPLVATKEAIIRALDACKAQAPEAGLKHDQREINERIEHVEEAILEPMPRLPNRPMRRGAVNLS